MLVDHSRRSRPIKQRDVQPTSLVVGACLCVLCGALLARGGTLAHLALAGAVVACLLPLLHGFGQGTLPFWVATSVVAYPFLRYPAGHSILTYDRLFIIGLLSWIVLPPPGGTAPCNASRMLSRSVMWLVVAFGLRTVFTAGAQLPALTKWLDAILLPAVVFAAARRFSTDRDRARQLSGALTVAGCVLAVLGVAESVLGFELASASGGTARFDTAVGVVRVSGPYTVPEVFAICLLVCLAGTLCWTLTRGRSAYLIGGAAASLQVLAIGLTLFRSAWVAAVVVVVIVLGIRPGRTARALAVTALVAVVAGYVYVQLGNSPVMSSRLHDRDNVRGRFATYQVALSIAREAPLVGVGVDRFYEASASATHAYVGGAQSLRHPHSSYMGILAEQGLFGFAPLVAVTVSAWWMVHVLRRRAGPDDAHYVAAITAGAVAYLVMSLSLTMLPYGPSNAFVALLLGAGAGRLDALTSAGQAA